MPRKPRGIKKKGKGIFPKGRPKNAAKRQRTRKKAKVKSISQLIKLCDREFSIQVRMKGAWEGLDGTWWNEDYTSGLQYPIKKLHCGHYLSRYYKAARWDFDNARPQSYMANIHMRGDPIKFRQKLIKEIGEKRVLNVEKLRDAPIKLTREFLEQTLTSLKGV